MFIQIAYISVLHEQRFNIFLHTFRQFIYHLTQAVQFFDHHIFVNLERQLVITDNVVRLLIGHANTFFQLVIVDGRRKPRIGLLNFAGFIPLFDVNSHL